ncbi:uncharacterized protein [Eleutherodactylus coqui]
MSHSEEQPCDAQGKSGPKKRPNKTLSLVDYVSDATRTEGLVGLKYVVEIKMLDSDKSIVKCNMCNVEGQMVTMKEHLAGSNHIRVYMEKYHYLVLTKLERSSKNKTQFIKLLKDYAKRIERAEGTQSVNIEYVSAADMNKEQENWLAAQEESGSHGDQKKFQVLDKRQMALSYSEKFKITSRDEATVVLNLTQQLSNQLEQYILKCKGLDVLNASTPDSSSTISRSAPINSPYDNPHPTGAANQGLNDLQWRTEGPSSSMSSACTSTSVHSLDRAPLEDTRAEKRRACASPSECSSASEFRSGKKRPHKECDDPPTVRSSSSSYMNIMGSHQQSSSGGSSRSSSIAATYTNVNNPKERSYVPEMFEREMRTVTDTPHISQNSLKDKTSKIQEKDSLKGTCTGETSEVGAAENPANPGPSSSDGNCFSEARSERPSSSHTQGNTSKTLSPDILHLLKGKDANTVTNILRTLSPFYPALQDVNLEILAQVLVNTGALD